MSDRKPNCEWVLERLEAFIDGELGDAGQAAVRAHCVACGDCTRELELAIRVRRGLRELPAFAAPARVVDAAEIAVNSAGANVVPLPHRRTRGVFRAVTVAAAIALVGATVWFERHERVEREQREDVRRATAELALAFGYVDRYSGGVVREDVIEKRVIPHIERAIARDTGTPRDSGTARDSAKQDTM